MRIVVVSAFYSEGMGYAENCLPKALASLGHDVHVVTSTLNVYGNAPDYAATYGEFLGAADQGIRRFRIDGYTVHRVSSRLVAGYVLISGLASVLRALRPDVVHCTEIASLQTFQLAALRPWLGYKLFAETHQHLSVVKPYLKDPGGARLKRIVYGLTRSLPTAVSSLAVEKCYAISPDCMYVAREFYRVPEKKLTLQSLGTDTELFHAAETPAELATRREMRSELGYAEDDIVCIYTGRFSPDKNPLLLARAVQSLPDGASCFRSLFIGQGVQRSAIESCRNAKVLSFMTHTELADFYRLADVAVWPRQESMSMLDAAASELPLVVSGDIGENERVAGNGVVYDENDESDLARALSSLKSRADRKALGAAGRAKMVARFSWLSIAKSLENDYRAVLPSPNRLVARRRT